MLRTATSVWKGAGKTGGGNITTGSKVLSNIPYNFTQRFGDEPGTNPEELIAAAHAGCYAMALSRNFEDAGITTEELTVTANITMEKTDEGMTVTKSHLVLLAKVPGVTLENLQRRANAAKEGCPISRLLENSIDITLDAQLAA
jgi:osmotically inducible protein OsmC